MGFLHAYFVGRVIAKAMQEKPRTAGELLKDSALGWLYFLCFLGCFAVFVFIMHLMIKYL